MTKIIYVLVCIFTINVFAISQIKLSPYLQINTGSWPDVVKISDMNNDGLNDVILGTNKNPYYVYPNDYSIMIFTQNSFGRLNPPVNYSFYIPEFNNYTFLEQILSLDVGDLNQDGLKDLIIGYGDRYGIYYQTKSGTLDKVKTFYLGNWELVESVRIGDVNSDGINEIIILSYTSLRILTQEANGSFKTKIINKINGEPNRCNEMEIADVNNDGRNDIITSSAGAWKLITYLQTKDGEISSNRIITYVDHWVNDFCVGDLNGDNKKDIAFTKSENTNPKIRILYQNQSDTLFNHYIEIPAYDLPDCLQIADLNNDGVNEIITIHAGWLKMSIYTSKNKVFSDYQSFDIPYATNYDKEGIIVGDINNDGLKDIVISDYNHGIIIFYNKSSVSNSNEEIIAENIIYPNPTSDYIYLNKVDYKYESVEIYNFNGNMILNNKITTNKISVLDLAPGCYFLKLNDKSGNYKKSKFIKK
jgi:hypothetical protein